MILCRTCNKLKETSDFYTIIGRKQDFECKICRRLRAKRNHKANPEQSKHHQLKNKFGISIQEYREMQQIRKNKCDICDKSEVVFSRRGNKIRDLSVDHNHKTSRVRGLLCQGCNKGIGLLREDIKILNAAIKYLRKHNE